MRKKGTVGLTYKVFKDSCRVDCTFLCPYCRMKSEASFSYEKTKEYSLEILDSGEFFEELSCSFCGNIAKARFHKCCELK